MPINFACESRDKFCACMIENWTIVGIGYFSHAASDSENVASARRVTPVSLTLTWDGKMDLYKFAPCKYIANI